MLTSASFCTVLCRSLSGNLHCCRPSNPWTIVPIGILSRGLLLGLNDFGQYWRCCVEVCDGRFHLLCPCVELDLKLTWGQVLAGNNLENGQLFAFLRAWESQKRIGFWNLVKGWVSKDWTRAMKAYESKDWQGHVVQIITLIWDGFCKPTWVYRNTKQLHWAENSAMSTMLRSLGERLQWFQDNKTIVLAPRHYMLAEYRMENATTDVGEG
jgi:hypothetical protein